MTPHHVRPDHHELPRGTRLDGAGHDGTSLNRLPRQSTAPAGLWAPAPVEPPKPKVRRKQPTLATGRPSRAKGTRKVAECGKDSGYKKHWREGTEICEPCRAAHRIAARLYDQAQRDRKQYVREHCGTVAGFDEHTRRKERKCDACKKAANEERAA